MYFKKSLKKHKFFLGIFGLKSQNPWYNKSMGEGLSLYEV